MPSFKPRHSVALRQVCRMRSKLFICSDTRIPPSRRSPGESRKQAMSEMKIAGSSTISAIKAEYVHEDMPIFSSNPALTRRKR